MVLVDTSVWIDHLRMGDDQLATILEKGLICCHPFVVGEITCGNLRNRDEVLSLLRQLPSATMATHDEVLLFIETKRLMGRGIGYVGAHLLASTALTGSTQLWTRDKRLKTLAKELGVAFEQKK